MKPADLLAFARRHPGSDHLMIETGTAIMEVGAFDVDVFNEGGSRCLLLVADDDDELGVAP